MSFQDAAVAAGREDKIKKEVGGVRPMVQPVPPISQKVGQVVPPGQPKPQIVKTYDYTDAAGNLRFQVVRYEPKDFRQRRPAHNGQWIWSVKGVKLVLYNLPVITKSEYVLIVEGEKVTIGYGGT